MYVHTLMRLASIVSAIWVDQLVTVSSKVSIKSLSSANASAANFGSDNWGKLGIGRCMTPSVCSKVLINIISMWFNCFIFWIHICLYVHVNFCYHSTELISDCKSSGVSTWTEVESGSGLFSFVLPKSIDCFNLREKLNKFELKSVEKWKYENGEILSILNHFVINYLISRARVDNW